MAREVVVGGQGRALSVGRRAEATSVTAPCPLPPSPIDIDDLILTPRLLAILPHQGTHTRCNIQPSSVDEYPCQRIDSRSREWHRHGTPARQQRSSVPSLLFLTFVLFMLMNGKRQDLASTRDLYVNGLQSINWQLGNFSAWLNGTESNFTLISPRFPVRCDYLQR